MKTLRRLYFRLFPTYRRVDFKCILWDEADRLLKSPDGPNWRIAEEDAGLMPPIVALEKIERITE